MREAAEALEDDDIETSPTSSAVNANVRALLSPSRMFRFQLVASLIASHPIIAFGTLNAWTSSAGPA